MKTASSLIAQPIATTDGEFIARYSPTGLAGLDFPQVGRVTPCAPSAQPLVGRASPRAGIPSLPSSTLHPPSSVPLSGWHRLTVAALKNVLAGRPMGKLPPLDWSGTTDFQQAVWREMLKLQPGQTRSYGEIARLIGRPRAVRAVGGACGANPIPVLVPCHRVLAAGHRIGGFGGGLDWKHCLLAREGVVLV